MAVPRNRHSNSRKKKKLSHQAKEKVNIILCQNCNNDNLPHKICPHCGFYKNKVIKLKKESTE
ncbi:MAG: 50S ribosomal protein L32 [Chlamydiae bacterium SM23_39]|nr:MAG: 50S ribosomal protein L32 [Chlamydiae bacterium SM23_39]